jgi:hypothetical protein
MIKQLQLPVVRLVFVARYPVLLGLMLASLAPLAVWGKPDLLRNLLVLDRPVQLFHVTWLSLLVAALVLVAFRIVQINASARFHIALPDWAIPHGPWRMRWLLWLGIGLAVPTFCSILTAGDPNPGGWPASGLWDGLLAALMVALGVGATLLILLLLTALQQYLLHPQVVAENLLPFESWAPFRHLKEARVSWLYWLGDKLAAWLDYLGPG